MKTGDQLMNEFKVRKTIRDFTEKHPTLGKIIKKINPYNMFYEPENDNQQNG